MITLITLITLMVPMNPLGSTTFISNHSVIGNQCNQRNQSQSQSHPIHVSIAEIDHNEQSKALQITLRIFIDDLELSIRNKVHDQEMDLLKPGGTKDTDQLVKEYLSEVLKLKVDKKAVQTHYLGHEIEGPAMICYIEVENIKKFKTIEVTNRAILETHDDQSNLVNVNYKDKVKSLRLTNQKPTDQVTFDVK